MAIEMFNLVIVFLSLLWGFYFDDHRVFIFDTP